MGSLTLERAPRPGRRQRHGRQDEGPGRPRVAPRRGQGPRPAGDGRDRHRRHPPCQGPGRPAAQVAAGSLLRLSPPRSPSVADHGLRPPGVGHHDNRRQHVAARLEVELVPGGEVFRAMAAEQGHDPARVRACTPPTTPTVDVELDSRLAERARDGRRRHRVAPRRLDRPQRGPATPSPCASTARPRSGPRRVAGREGIDRRAGPGRQHRAPAGRARPLPGALRHRPRRPVDLRPGARLRRARRPPSWPSRVVDAAPARFPCSAVAGVRRPAWLHPLGFACRPGHALVLTVDSPTGCARSAPPWLHAKTR